MSGEGYRLLIADDEYWTREKMRYIIPWEKYNIEFMEPAENGEKVLQKMERETPDILISDINMPIINGVELVERIRERYPQVITFIVSGYDNFNYVKNTMKAGAINYLLKPINKAELIHAVSEAMNIINGRRLKEQEDANMRSKLQRAASMLQDHEYSRLIDKNSSANAGDFSVNLSMESAGYGFILLKVHNMKYAMDAFHQDINQVSYAVKSRLKDSVDEDIIIFNNTMKSNEFIIISREQDIHNHLAAIKYIRVMEELFSSPVTVVFNNYSYSVESMYRAYTQAVSLLMTRRYHNKSEVIIQDTKEGDIQGQNDIQHLSEETGSQLKALMKSHNKQMVKELIGKSLRICKERHSTYLDVKQVIRQINSLLMSNSSGLQGAGELLDVENAIDEAERRVESLDIDELIRYEEEVVDSLMAEVGIVKTETMNDTVRQVKAYIDQFYFEDLSLASLADKFAAEPSYLSKSFKQYSGENLTTYIARQKIEHSLKYIAEGRLSLSEVAFMVGYDDYTYFSRVFKKVMAMSPRDYKGNRDEKHA